ncbi:MAG: hypothetical protein K940chlam3_00978 [Chlamydiae bacterium]|nr:hypothetical protein [Chlamydiota bacterium]
MQIHKNNLKNTPADINQDEQPKAVLKSSDANKAWNVTIPGVNWVQTRIAMISMLFYISTYKLIILIYQFSSISSGYLLNKVHRILYPGEKSIQECVEKWESEDPGEFPVPPEDGLKIGMPNSIYYPASSGNTCWFNSLMKFIAATTHFDSVFEPRAEDDEVREEVRTALRKLIICLRTAPKGYIQNRSYLELLESMKKVSDFEEKIEGQLQCSPMEFLRDVLGLLDFKTLETPIFGRHYESHFDENLIDVSKSVEELSLPVKYGKGDVPDFHQTFIRVDIPSENKRSKDSLLDLPVCIASHSELNGSADEAASHGGISENYKFHRIFFPIHLPNELFISLNRMDQNHRYLDALRQYEDKLSVYRAELENYDDVEAEWEKYDRLIPEYKEQMEAYTETVKGKEIKPVKPTRPSRLRVPKAPIPPNVEDYKNLFKNKIAMNDQREITFTVYRSEINAEGDVIGKIPVQNKIYRVAGTVIHKGTSANSGHYVATELTEGRRIEHNDLGVSILADSDRSEENASLLRLTLVREEDLLSSD